MSNPSKKKITSKQIVAIIGIVLLLSMYLITFVVSVFGDTEETPLFLACMISTLAVPSLIWIYIWLWGKMTGRHTIADAPEQKNNENK